MRRIMESGEMEGMNDPVRDDVRRMAYVKMVMREFDMSQKEAEEFVTSNKLVNVIKMFQKRDPEKMEDEFETIRGSMGKIRGQMKELEYE